MTGRALTQLVRRPRRSRVIGVAILAVLAGAVTWYFGLDTLRAVSVAGVVAALGIAWVALPVHALTGWPDPALRGADGARHDVVELSWSLRSRGGGVRDAALQRLRGVARTRLAARHLDVDDPNDSQAIEALIGADAYRTIHGAASARRAPGLRAVVRCLDALEQLDRGGQPERSTRTSTAQPDTDRKMKEPAP